MKHIFLLLPFLFGVTHAQSDPPKNIKYSESDDRIALIGEYKLKTSDDANGAVFRKCRGEFIGLVTDRGTIDRVKLIKLPFAISEFCENGEPIWLVEFSDFIGLNKSRVVLTSAWVSPRSGDILFNSPWFVDPPQDKADAVVRRPEDVKHDKIHEAIPDFKKAMLDLGVFSLSGPNVVGSSTAVKSLVEKAYAEKTGDETNQQFGTSCPKFVKLPFAVDGFNEVDDLLWQVDIISTSNIRDPMGVLASAWIHPKSGVLIFYSAPWYVEAPKPKSRRIVTPPK